ncbi:alkane 1-monooxygenase [Bacillus sp. FJAT-27264]|uniref:LLM class flavin-dependent oxidoreductase n=1 Tax=Paenibacillus sp. (strain DSM 101736 / FJAT-27264) TaxID=1850362 RepID=UPI00080812DB|nr:LLM class flavin-dependent oxidoreductase [Bacillus sp. FJAT-27264]OBZ16138.1 alkane 1-monooxygenase [Bacillus sp. FJAT-27264]
MVIIVSILDSSPLLEGETTEDALALTVKLAQKAEQLGFYRFWVAEHHGMEHATGSSPEVLVSYLLAKTDRIRIGAGGVMLQHYSPYKVAENFNVLAALAPGRVDLGIGRAPGGLPRSARALQRGAAADPLTVEEKLSDLKHFVHDNLAGNHPLAGLKVMPSPAVVPDIYLLGASVGSAELAAKLGLPYVFSYLINSNHEEVQKAIHVYHSSFRSEQDTKPAIIVSLTVEIAETEEDAKLLTSEQKAFRVNLSSGKAATLLTRESAEEFGNQSGEDFTIIERKFGIIQGTKESVREQLLSLQKEFSVSEFIISSNTTSSSKRLRWMELLSETLSEN